MGWQIGHHTWTFTKRGVVGSGKGIKEGIGGEEERKGKGEGGGFGQEPRLCVCVLTPAGNIMVRVEVGAKKDVECICAYLLRVGVVVLLKGGNNSSCANITFRLERISEPAQSFPLTGLRGRVFDGL